MFSRTADNRKLKVAAYCRVSTDEEDQLNSLETQMKYYTGKISENSEWTFAGIYADEGISGTSVDKRKEFMRLMRDCQKGKVDYILTKSTTRFARNTVDSLTWVRKLRAIGVGVMFEEQNLDSLKAENETFIGFYSVMAQSESESISGNVKWGVRKRMKNGTYKVRFDLLGYSVDKDGNPYIVPAEAEAVRTIFKMFLDGASLLQLQQYLEGNGFKTPRGKSVWQRSVISYMLKNEKYVGDVLYQKTYRRDCISKKVLRNNGELTRYLISNNHPAIIDRETFNLVQLEIARRSNKRKKSDKGLGNGSKNITVRSYQRSFELLLQKQKIPHHGFHALRHTFATRAIECGMDVKSLSEILGHKNPTITLKRYVHSFMEHKREFMNRLGKLL